MAESEFGVAMCGCLLALSNEALVDGLSCILAWFLALCSMDCGMKNIREGSQPRYICLSSFNIAAHKGIITTAGERCVVNM